jgi:hypothetical protein
MANHNQEQTIEAFNCYWLRQGSALVIDFQDH